MKTIIISFIAMTMLQFVLCDLMADLKQEFDSIDSGKIHQFLKLSIALLFHSSSLLVMYICYLFVNLNFMLN